MIPTWISRSLLMTDSRDDADFSKGLVPHGHHSVGSVLGCILYPILSVKNLSVM